MMNCNVNFIFSTTVFVLSCLDILSPVASRAVNISNTWILPEEGFPVFYRYFRDRISWYEADAVCQFHHANLVTVDTTAQYDATRAYLKELDIVNNVWIGLIKSKPDGEFTWTERREYRPLSHDGFWEEQMAQSTTPTCVSTDPAADFRWHGHHCGGPEVASFICELPVPTWASQPNGCMLTSLPSLTVLYLPEQAAVELTSDCGLGGTKSIVCKGQADREEMIRQLSCGISPEDFEDKNLSKSTGSATSLNDSESITPQTSTTVAPSSSRVEVTQKDTSPTKAWFWSSNTIDLEENDAPTRHRRETDLTELPATLSTLHASTKVKVMKLEAPTSSIEDFKLIDDMNQKLLIRNENLADVETFNPEIGPRQFEELISDGIEDKSSNGLDDINIEKHIENFDGDKDNFFAAVQQMDQPYNNSGEQERTQQFFYVTTITNTNKQTTISSAPATTVTVPLTTGQPQTPTTTPVATTAKKIPTEQKTSSSSAVTELSTLEPSFEKEVDYDPSSVINQGQLFNVNEETGVPQQWLNDFNEWNETSDLENVTTPPEISSKSSQTLEKVVINSTVKPEENLQKISTIRVNKEEKSFETAAPSTARELISTTTSTTTKEPLSENIKLLELDTDFVATRKQDNNTKFIEIDDAFTIGDSATHEHKIIEINIIDRKDNTALPSKLFITTKLKKEPKQLPPNQVFTSSVKKDGRNIQPPTKIMAFNETFQEMSNDTTVQDLVIINPKISSVNNNTKHAMDILIPDRIIQQEIETRKQQQANFEFQTKPILKLNDLDLKESNQFVDLNSDSVTTDFGTKDEDDFNSEVPPSHKHRGRLLTRSPHHNYYPYFFSRVLG